MGQLNIPYPIRRAPVIGPWAAKVGTIIDVNTTPCNQNNLVIVRAAWVALPRLLWAIAKPDAFDMYYDLKSGGLGRKRKRNFRVKDVTQPLRIPQTGKIASVAFKVGDLAQRAGFYMMIVDATLDFIVNWTSAVYQMSGCLYPGDNRVDMELTGGIFSDTGGAWAQIGNWSLVDQQGMTSNPAGIAVAIGDTAYVGCNMVVGPDPFGRPPLEGLAFRIRQDPSGIATEAEDATPDLDGNQGATVQAQDWDAHNVITTYRVDYRASAGFGVFIGSQFFASMRRYPGIDPDP